MNELTSTHTRMTVRCLLLAAVFLMTSGVELPARDMATVPGRTITVRIPVDADATLIETTDGRLANGSGSSIFVGRTQQPSDSRRRSLLRFDVASEIPRRAIIEDATLILNVLPGTAPAIDVRVFRVLRPWTEGPAISSGGNGALAMPGDVTWIHRSYDIATWRRPGGVFVRRASAAQTIAGPGLYEWRKTVRRPRAASLQDDVQFWLSVPERNFGWILIGGEGQPRTAKKITSREGSDADARPMLEIRYRMPLPGLQRPL
ncbi:MAG: DNRLRE domain-containing protein [Acidobacteriota bacterium]|nr:DNRLRE domain-containing protein [Acidobacteriota bacterium]MDH3784656.1 DNRLRE domain-containing protein [Acidobacteriota bacterium]